MALQPSAAVAQLPTLGGLASDLATLTTTVSDQGVKITANTNTVNTLNNSLNTVTTTVSNQATVLQAVQTRVDAQVANLATVTTRIGQHDAQISANLSGLTSLTSDVGTLSGVVVGQGTVLQALRTSVSAGASDLTALTDVVGRQSAQIGANTGTLGTLAGSLGTLTGTVSDQAATLQSVRTAVTANVADVAGLSATVGRQGAQIAANIGAVGTLAGTLGTLTTAVDGQASTLRSVQAAVGANVADLATLSVTVGQQGNQGSINTGAIATLTGTVGTLAATVGDTGTQVLRNIDDIGDLQARVGANVGQIALLQANLGSTDSDVSRLQTAVADHEVRITTNTADIGALTATVTSQGGRIVRQGSDLETANANIASLQSILGAQGGTLATLGADLAGQATLNGSQDTQIQLNTAAILSLRNMAVSGNASPVQFVTPEAPLVASATATNDVAILGAQAVPVRLHNVADGSVAAGSTDAINGGQLDGVAQRITGLAGLAVQYDDADRGRISLGGASAAPVVLANVRAATLAQGSTEAVNGGQLNDTNIAVGGVRDTVTSLSGLVVTQGVDIAGLTTRLGGLDTFAQAQSSLLTEQGNQIAINIDALATLRRDTESGAIGPIRYSTPASPTSPNGGQVTNDLTLVGRDPSAVKLHNVAAGIVGAGSTDAVNGGQLFALSESYVGLADLAVRYDDAAHDSITLGGRGIPVMLRNIMAGTLAAGSTDAVNGSQLLGLGNAVAGVLGGNARYDPLSGFGDAFSFEGQSYANIQSVFGAIEGSLATGSGQQPDPGDTDSAISAKYFHANSTMKDSEATGFDATAIGPASRSTGEAAIALGRNTLAEGTSSVAIGDGATAKDGKAVSIGLGNMASGDGAVAIGDPNLATGEGAVALGKDNISTGVGAIALGNVNQSFGEGAAAIGSLNRSTGQGAAAFGYANVAEGLGAIAIGSGNRAVGDGSLAIGSDVFTSANDTLAIGHNAAALGGSSVSIGNRARASDFKSSSVGDDAIASGAVSAAFGASAEATGVGSTALGALALSNGYGSTALGTGAIANMGGSVALGSAAQTVRGEVDAYTAFGLKGSQRSLGEIAIARNLTYYDPVNDYYTPTGNRQITGLAAGSADTDAVNIAQLRGVSGTLGAALAGGFGSGATYDAASGSLVGPSYTFNGATYSNVGDALQALAARAVGTSATSGGSTTTTVSYDTPAGTDVTLAPTGTTIHNVAPGNVAPGSTDAVNGGQLAQTSADVASLAASVANGATGPVQYADKGTAAANGGTKTNDLTLVGADTTAAVTLHNVAAGQIAPGSSDAVNGAQLASTDARVGIVEARVATVENKADQALAAGSRAVQYDDGGTSSVTLGAGGQAVVLRNVAAGMASTDAVNLNQLSTAMTNAVGAANAYTDQRIAGLSFDLGQVNRNADAGAAGAMALAGMPQAFEEGKNLLAMGVSTFRGQSAFAAGLSRIMEDGRTIVKLGATYNSRKQVGANAGIGYQF